MFKNPQAFIFDLDGVITDTAEWHYQAWKSLASGLGITIDRDFNERLKGVSRMESLEKILALDPSLKGVSWEKKQALTFEKNEHYKRLIGQIDSSYILPGIESLIHRLREKKIPIALGSASKNAVSVLNQLGLIEHFDYIVDASKIQYGKPHPETFLNAADYLSVPYQGCIGIEDAPTGVTALNEAGMFSIGIGQSEHLAHADYRLNVTSELDFDQIIEAFGAYKNR